MGSYEELVVDRSVDAAWLDFRVRLADHLAAMGREDLVELEVDRGGRRALAYVRMWAVDDESVRVVVLFESEHGPVQRPAPGLRACGFDRGTMTVCREEVDVLCLALTELLRGPFAVVHPAFIYVGEGDLVLVEPPRQIVAAPAAPALPESVAIESPGDLTLWVDRTLTERFGHPPMKRDDGSIGCARDDDRLVVRLSSTRAIVEVYATIARDVDVKRAQKIAGRLNTRYYFFRFFVSGDALMMATTVSGRPFVPAHLDNAMDMVFDFLAAHGPRLRTRTARRAPKPVEATDAVIDTDLLLVYGAASDRKAMIAMARRLANDSRTCLGQWRHAADRAGRLAKQKAAGVDHGPVQSALIDQVIAWRSVADAIGDAVAAIADDQQAV